MTGRRAASWTVALGSMVLLGIALGIALLVGRQTLDLIGLAFSVGVVVTISGLAGVGALLISRVPANAVGYLLLAAGALLSSGLALGSYAETGARAEPGPWPGASILGSLAGPMVTLSIVTAGVFIPLVFPTGRLLGDRWRWIVWLGIAAAVGTLIQLAPAGNNLLGIAEALVALSLAICLVGAAAAVVIRYRTGDRVTRLQVKWFTTFAGVGAAALAASNVVPGLLLGVRSEALEAVGSALWGLGMLSYALLPIAVGIAVLRYRLYDIDRIISRGVSYAIVVAVMTGLFTGAVLLLQGALSEITQGQSLAVAASTLLALVVFQPLRRRVQKRVDRRFDRTRYDAQQMADSLSERLRNEVDLDHLRLALLETANHAVRPSCAAVWLDSSGAQRPM